MTLNDLGIPSWHPASPQTGPLQSPRVTSGERKITFYCVRTQSPGRKLMKRRCHSDVDTVVKVATKAALTTQGEIR